MDEYDLKCKRKLAQLVENNQNVLRELEEIHVCFIILKGLLFSIE